MKTKTAIKQISLRVITFLLLGLWLLVALEKLWDLKVFHISLLKQPFPNWWANTLFWLLPLLELFTAVLIAWPKKRRIRHVGMWFSFILMLGFTLFIAFGVMDFYEKRPCSCSSVIAGLSWEQHLRFNAFFLLLSVTGIWLTKPTKTINDNYNQPKSIHLKFKNKEDISLFTVSFCVLFKLFTKLFAVFRRRAEEKIYFQFQIKSI